MLPAEPIVSIIMPVYNGEQYLADAVQSVIAQTTADWELIIIDDGSTDTTPLQIQAYTDKRIRSIQQANAGRSTARNRGLSLVKGQFILFLDADDILLPNCLESHLAFLAEHPNCDGSISDCELIDATGTFIVLQSKLRQRYVPDYANISREGGIILEPLIISAPLIGAPHNVMINSKAIQRTRAHFDCEMFMGEDWDFWIQVAEKAHFGFVDKVLCRYRWHQQNTIASHTLRARRDSLLRNRYRVLSAPYFDSLQQGTRWIFFHHMLLTLLCDNPIKQQEILSCAQFKQLPSKSQAQLLRLVAMETKVENLNLPFVGWCLEQAVHLWPFPSLEYWTKMLWHVSPKLLQRLWQLKQHLSQTTRRKESDPDIVKFMASVEPSNKLA